MITQRGAVSYAFAAFLCWVLTDTWIKMMGLSGLPPFPIMTVLGLVGALTMVVAALRKGDISLLRPKHKSELALLGLTTTIINYANAVALKHLPLTVFYLVVFTSPLVITAASAWMKHEKLTAVKITCLTSGFIGAVITIYPNLVMGGEWIGYLMALTGVVAFAAGTMVIKKIARDETPESQLFWNALPFGLCGLFFSFDSVAQIAPLTIVLLAATGLLNVLATGLYNKALRYTSPSNVAQIHYTQIILGAIIGYILWHEVPTWNLWLGSTLIIGAGLVVALQADQK